MLKDIEFNILFVLYCIHNPQLLVEVSGNESKDLPNKKKIIKILLKLNPFKMNIPKTRKIQIIPKTL